MPKTPLSFYLHMIAVAVIVFALGHFFYHDKDSSGSVSTSVAQKESVYDRVIRTGIIRCGYMVWKPWMVVDPNTKEFSGLNYDLVNQLAANLGLKIEWTQEVLPGQQVTALQSGKIDMVCTAEGPFDAAAGKYIDYSDAIVYQPADAYVRADDRRFDSNFMALNDPNVKISVMDGDLTFVLAKKFFPKATLHQLPQSADPAQLMLDVVTGKSDMIIMDPPTIEYFTKDNNLVLRKVPASEPFALYPNMFSVNKGEDKFLNMINITLESFRNTGELEILLKNYETCTTLFYRPAKSYQPPAQ
ncbi:MAG: transporter substrate-binding domain-containing protein [Alphaproteobacteria bacterium]|nr:MAG: transporter substrate-binding domain-containing protein [Alphaproteobacteria bacterium]